MAEERVGRKPSFAEALLVLAVIAAVISGSVLKLGLDAHVPIFLCAVFTAVMGIFVLKHPWKKIESGMINGIMIAMQAILILTIVGSMIGAWVQSGVVPSLIYYGLDLLAPGFFLLATLFVCSIVSLATGSSWTTSGTVGIAMMGIAAGLGIPAHVTAGFIISGAYFGDKMSPLSDTTNLAPAVAGNDVFDHIRAMLWTTGPTYIIVAVIAGFMGMKYAGGTLDATKISLIQQIMQAEFHVSLLGFIPPVLVIVMAAAKIPAIPGLIIGMLAGSVMSLFQGVALGDVMSALHYGYETSIANMVAEAGSMDAVTEALKGVALVGENINLDMVHEVGTMLADLLTRGGLDGMMWTISLILLALALGGIMETCGFLEVLLEKILGMVHSVGGLVTAVIASCIFSNLFLGDQYLSIVMPGRLFKTGFENFEYKGKKGLAPRMLSRTLEDAGTLTSSLVPWNTCGAYQSSVLGIHPFAYAPYAFLNWLNPLVAILISYLGIGVFWKEDMDKNTDES
jgi:NhaC family Na+:H+ antiporter